MKNESGKASLSAKAHLDEGRRVVLVEAESLKNMAHRLTPAFGEVVEMLGRAQGKIVATGVGKSGLVAQKFASTLASFGRPAVFIHPTDAVHGDMGTLGRRDVLFAISQSGNTQELLNFISVVKHRFGIRVVSLVGVPGGEMERLSDLVLCTHVTDEACALGLAPTASSTAALALTDAVAVAVSRLTGLKATDYAAFHPAGALGHRLYTPVARLMRRSFPVVDGALSLKQVAPKITGGKLGFVVVRDRRRGRLGVVTDGDIRRAAMLGPDAFKVSAALTMSYPPKSIAPEALGMDALMEMERSKITSLLVLNRQKKLVGVLHLHDVLRFGLNLSTLPKS